MTFDELVLAISNSDALKHAAQNMGFLFRWKSSTDDVQHLVQNMNKFLMVNEFEREALEELKGYWDAFKAASIDNIHGMTMNERLNQFGLFPKFDNSKNKTRQDRIYAKLMAHR